MILTKEQIKKLDDGEICIAFFAGSDDLDFGKTKQVIKVKDKLYEIKGFFNIDEDLDDEGYEMIISIK